MKLKELKINNKIISETSKPFIIAEVGVNYYDIAKKQKISPIDAAKLMISEAAKSLPSVRPIKKAPLEPIIAPIQTYKKP